MNATPTATCVLIRLRICHPYEYGYGSFSACILKENEYHYRKIKFCTDKILLGPINLQYPVILPIFIGHSSVIPEQRGQLSFFLSSLSVHWLRHWASFWAKELLWNSHRSLVFRMQQTGLKRLSFISRILIQVFYEHNFSYMQAASFSDCFRYMERHH